MGNIDDLKASLIAAQKAAAAVTVELTTLSASNLASNERIKNLESQVAILHVDLARIRVENENGRKLLAEAQSTISQLQAEIARLKQSSSTPAPQQPTPTPTPAPAPTPTTPTPTTPVGYKLAVPLKVKEVSGYDRLDSLCSAGVPIPENLNIETTDVLALEDPDGKLIPADFRVTAKWRSKKSPNGIQWVVVSLIVPSLKASAESGYRLLIGVPAGTNPRPAHALAVGLLADSISTAHIRTGVASFTISSRLFDSIKLGDKEIVNGAISSATFNGQESSALQLRRLELEYAGPLVAYIQTESVFTDLKFGRYQTNNVSPGPISLYRRYRFVAGSANVQVQERIAWEGTMNGTNYKKADGSLNAVLGSKWLEILPLSGTVNYVEVGNTPDDVGKHVNKNRGRLTQKLRANRWDADKKATVSRQSEMKLGDTVTSLPSTPRSAGSLFAGGIDNPEVGVFLRQMQNYEPQALEYANGRLSINLADDRFWLAYNQGCQVEFSLCLSPLALPAPDYKSRWADTNFPLRCLAAPEYYQQGAVAPLPPQGPATQKYVTALETICKETLRLADKYGCWGLQTWGGIPRYWDETYQEVGSGLSGWDDLYKNGAFTDYYSTSASATRLALITSNPQWLNDLSFPIAQRMLHTQIMQNAPEDKWFYAGMSPTGYGAYRSDFNSSHQYWDGLMWYYYLTGDRTVVDTLSRGMSRSLDYFFSQPIVGRAAMQHVLTYRFLGHCHHNDAQGKRFSDGFDALMIRAIKEQYKEGIYQGQLHGFWLATVGPISETLNLYAQGIWDMWAVHLLALRFPEGIPGLPVQPIQVLARTARTEIELAPKVVNGDGTIQGKWARGFKVTLSPDLKTIVNVEVQPSGGETTLYPDDKGGLVTHWVYAAKFSGDVLIKSKADELIEYVLNSIISKPLPMGKISGLREIRLGAAIAESHRS